MKKKLLSVAVATVMIAPLAAQASDGPTVYGKVHVSVDHVDYDDNTRGDYWQVESRASRLGFKGSEDLGNGLKAIYKMEFQIDVTDESGADNVTARNQYVGLSGNWGTFLMGRHDTPYKVLTGKDMFSDTIADWNKLGFTDGAKGIVEDHRANNAIMYTSPSFNGLTLAAMVSPGEDSTDDGIDDYYTSVGAKYSNGPLYLAAAWEETEFDGNDSANPLNDDETRWRVYGSYKIGDFKLGAMYQDTESENNLKDVDAQAWQLQGAYTMGSNVLKLAYQDGEIDDNRTASKAGGYDSPQYDAWVAAVEHHLSKRTYAYAIYTQSDTNSDAQNAASRASGSEDWDAFSLGLVHKF